MLSSVSNSYGPREQTVEEKEGRIMAGYTVTALSLDQKGPTSHFTIAVSVIEGSSARWRLRRQRRPPPHPQPARSSDRPPRPLRPPAHDTLAGLPVLPRLAVAPGRAGARPVAAPRLARCRPRRVSGHSRSHSCPGGLFLLPPRAGSHS